MIYNIPSLNSINFELSAYSAPTLNSINFELNEQIPGVTYDLDREFEIAFNLNKNIQVIKNSIFELSFNNNINKSISNNRSLVFNVDYNKIIIANNNRISSFIIGNSRDIVSDNNRRVILSLISFDKLSESLRDLRLDLSLINNNSKLVENLRYLNLLFNIDSSKLADRLSSLNLGFEIDRLIEEIEGDVNLTREFILGLILSKINIADCYNNENIPIILNNIKNTILYRNLGAGFSLDRLIQNIGSSPVFRGPFDAVIITQGISMGINSASVQSSKSIGVL